MIGCIIVVAIVSVLIWFFLFKKNKEKEKEKKSSKEDSCVEKKNQDSFFSWNCWIGLKPKIINKQKRFKIYSKCFKLHLYYNKN